jgi:hypothetical protein
MGNSSHGGTHATSVRTMAPPLAGWQGPSGCWLIDLIARATGLGEGQSRGRLDRSTKVVSFWRDAALFLCEASCPRRLKEQG